MRYVLTSSKRCSSGQAQFQLFLSSSWLGSETQKFEFDDAGTVELHQRKLPDCTDLSPRVYKLPCMELQGRSYVGLNGICMGCVCRDGNSMEATYGAMRLEGEQYESPTALLTKPCWTLLTETASGNSRFSIRSTNRTASTGRHYPHDDSRDL